MLNKTKRKGKISKYYCEIYNVYLVVADQYTKLEDLQKQYSYASGVELDKDILDGCACTCCCKDKKTEECVFLVKYNGLSNRVQNKKNSKQNDFVNTCTHEATHVALRIYEYIEQNICFCTPEPLCYLVGWISECIYKSIKP